MNKFKKLTSVLLLGVFVTTLSFSSFAQFIVNGVDYGTRANYQAQQAQQQQNAAVNNATGQLAGDLSQTAKDAKDQLNAYKSVMDSMKPDIGKGMGFLGDAPKQAVQTFVSILAAIATMIYVVILIWNGIVFFTPSLGEAIIQQEQGGSGGKRLLFISKNTKECLQNEEAGAGKWFKNEMKNLVFFVLIVFGVWSLTFVFMNFILNFFNV